MIIRQLNSAVVVAMVTAFLLTAYLGRAADNDSEVHGIVKSESGQPVWGAFVKLKNPERRLTFMVTSRAQGLYMAASLPAGTYTAQAIGDGLQSAWSTPVEVGSGKSVELDLSLMTQQAAALRPAWPSGYTSETEGYKTIPFPDGDGKQIVATRCVICHRAYRITYTRADQFHWEHIINQMRENMKADEMSDLTDHEARTVAQYLATNFPAVSAPDPNSRLPRTLLQGQRARYKAVQYEMATPYSQPHDIAIDPQGDGWVAQRSYGKLGRLDVRTLLYTEVSRPSGPVRMHNIEIDPNGKAWFQERAINCRWFSYDTRTGEWDVFTIPEGLKRDSSGKHVDFGFADGTVYATGSNEIIKLDIKTRKFSVFNVPSWVKTGTDVATYGLTVAGDGSVWFAESAVDKMGRLDPQTGEIDELTIPVKGRAYPRRMGTDAAGDVWVGLWQANKLMKIDHKTHEMTTYDPPTKDGGAYYVSVDKKNGWIWVSLQMADKLDRFNPKTGEWMEFSLPEAESDPRKIQVDSINPNRVWWTGDMANRFGYIEVLDEK
jgi:virginiamycin B lyase